ncbi:glycosyltransferase family 2 protein [Acidithiobacillus sp. CV18-2]|nr:glycosyltransferase family 2 protein [Acidithiobacillus sp. CV18-3]MBU2756303.1 glycosyltransferase family 2 protein [Acidithiobacillus sp. BN09-2]MBU2775924.1 glycosyltransferase family 2 protein [Acidithiobacillus sp. CV18-2]MBU2799122.1 glycosyltransferase family 2 protein [Acidithiobacillus sp. VAN18-4]
MISKVKVLLACYNGEKYLNQLLQSLEEQTYTDWELLIRDDGSSDSTLEIIASFQRKHPGKVQIIDSLKKHLGVIGSFSELMAASSADWLFFCDQDDVWLPEKISEMLSFAHQNELIPERVHLIHSDIVVVDERLQTLGESFFKYQRIDPTPKNLLNLLVQNNVTGCATMASRGLIEKSLSIPQESCMHDWWIALVAAAFGNTYLIEKPLLLYRQHGNNDTGAKKYNMFYVLKKIAFLKDALWRVTQTIAQSRAFLERYGEELPESARRDVQEFSMILTKPRLQRFILLARMGLRKSGFFRTFGFYFVIFLLSTVKDSPSNPGYTHTETPKT